MSLFKKSNNKTTMINLSKQNKNHLDIIYFDMGNPSIFIKMFKGNKLIKILNIPLSSSQIENGVILNNEFIITKLKELVNKERYSIDLKIMSSSIFKSIISLPKISKGKAEKLKKKEIKNSYDKFNKSYHMIEDKYHYNLGVVYQESFIMNDLIKNWMKISKGSNLKLSSVQVFSGYLFDLIKDKKDIEIIEDLNLDLLNQASQPKKKSTKKKKDKMMDFALIYVKENTATFILSSSSQLINGYSFEFKDPDEVIKRFILVIGKHEIEFEKKPIRDIYVESDIDLALNESFKNINVHKIHFKIFDEFENIHQEEVVESSEINEESKGQEFSNDELGENIHEDGGKNE